MGNFLLDISDFQSIGKAHLEFVQGINLILGQSNSGKTAILRAIDSVLSNPSYAKTFVRHRTNEAEVSLEYNDNIISWNKAVKGGTKYNVNGEDYSKVGTSDLFDILPNNGFVRGDNGEVMNIEGEWDLPFPFDRTPAELFRLFENIFCISDSATILKSFKEEETDITKQKNDTKDKIDKLSVKQVALEELSKEANLEKAKKQLIEFEKIAQEYFSTESDYSAIKRSETLGTFVIDEVNPPKEYTLQTYTDLYKELSFVTEVAHKIKFYKTLPEVMEVPNTIAEYKVLAEDVDFVDNAAKANNFKIDKKIEINPDNLTDYLNLLQDLQEIAKSELVSQFVIDKECSEESSLSLAEYESMAADLDDIMSCYRRCKALTVQCKDLSAKIEEIEKKLSEYKVCPLCGHELKGEHEC